MIAGMVESVRGDRRGAKGVEKEGKLLDTEMESVGQLNQIK
jgi:hypothetical protein